MARQNGSGISCDGGRRRRRRDLPGLARRTIHHRPGALCRFRRVVSLTRQNHRRVILVPARWRNSSIAVLMAAPWYIGLLPQTILDRGDALSAKDISTARNGVAGESARLRRSIEISATATAGDRRAADRPEHHGMGRIYRSLPGGRLC